MPLLAHRDGRRAERATPAWPRASSTSSLQMSAAIGLAVLGHDRRPTTRARSSAGGHAPAERADRRLPAGVPDRRRRASRSARSWRSCSCERRLPARPASALRAQCPRGRAPGRPEPFSEARAGRPWHHPLREETTMAVPPMPGLWNWPESATRSEFSGRGPPRDPDYAGYKVVANDGEIGHVDSFAIAPDEGHLVVDTGSWLFGACRSFPPLPCASSTTTPRPSRSTSPSSRSGRARVRQVGRLRRLPRPRAPSTTAR